MEGGRKFSVRTDLRQRLWGEPEFYGVLVGLEAGEPGAGTTVKHRLCCRALGVFW